MNALSIYKSSAGSGKTFTLVKEYLKIVLQNPSAYRHTLAITFTNKATAEMKERIVSAFVKLSEDKADDLKRILENEINNPNINIKERAKTILESILHDYSSFAVSTIDSFFSRIIRSLAKEMQLPLKFEMEMNQDYITSQLTAMLMDDIGKSDELTEWLEQFVFTKMEDDKGWNIEHEIKFIAKEIFTDRQKENTNHEGEINLAFIEVLKKIKYGFVKQMQEFSREFIQITDSAALDVSDFAHGSKGVAGYFIKIYNGLSGDKWIPGPRVTDALESPENWVSKKSLKRNEILELAESTFIPLLRKTISFYELQFKDYVSASEVLAMAYMAGIVNYLKGKMKNYRDENDILMISDTNKLLKEFITGSDAPFVYEKTGNQFQNYLIDEFQDTADLQWDNILPLVLNGLGSGGFVMFVGDAKQSIYRWRGGNMKLLLETIHQDLKAFSSIKNSFHLDTNYRSRKEIVDFNNAFFTLAPPLLPVSDDTLTKLAYQLEDTFQKNIESKSTGGFVSISLFPKKESNENDEDVKWKDAALTKMVETISVSLQQGYNMEDIAILVRSNKDGKVIADHLFLNGYKKISSADSLLLYTAPQIIFLNNILILLAYPENKPALAEVIYYYQRYILLNETTELHALFYASGTKAGWNDTDLLPSAWHELKNNLATIPLYELVEKLVDIFSLNKIPDAYIQRFQDFILDYSSKNPPALKDFLSWWDDHKQSEKYAVVGPNDKDAINIVSIHRAKGLQYPIVIMPFLDWSLKPKFDNLLWINSDVPPYNSLSLFPVRTIKQLTYSHFAEHYKEELDQNYLDNLNLLYVAFSRAEEKIYLTSYTNEKADKEISSVSQLLLQVINNKTDWQKYLKTNNGIVTLELGENHNSLSVQKEKKNDASFDEPANISMYAYPFNQWEKQLNIRVSRKDLAADEENEKAAAIDFGLLMHETMSLIKQHTDREMALQKIAKDHLLLPSEIAQLQSDLEIIFNLTEKEKWFDNNWQILNESEIAGPDGLINRPDRVMIRDHQAIVVDYKTGLRDQKHFNQVKEYATALMGMGYEKVDGYLLYLQDKKIEQVNL